MWIFWFKNLITIYTPASIGGIFLFQEEIIYDELFKEVVAEKIKDYMPQEYQDCKVEIHAVTKVNRDLDALNLIPAGGEEYLTSPTIYINNMYDHYVECDNLQESLKQGAETMTKAFMEAPNMGAMLDFNQAKDNIVMVLVNTEQNKGMLDTVPNRKFQDLSIIYRWVVDQDKDGIASSVVTYGLAEKLKMNEEQLYKAAVENTIKLFPPTVKSMNDVIRDDNGWNGTVCNNPGGNNACLRLKNIYENRNDQKENNICSQCMAGHEEDLPCLGEGAAFMSSTELSKTTIHPYSKMNPQTHGHFLPTDIIYPEYSFPARPYAWMMKGNIETLAEEYGINYNAAIEPVLKFSTPWIQEAYNHKAIFNYFYKDIVPDKSLCLAYAKQVPFVEDNRRVLIAMGHVKKICPAVEHAHTDEKSPRSLTWETHIVHSIRDHHEDGFVIPYKQMMEYCVTHPDFDMNTITVFAPEDAFAEFSYATEHVNHDAVIEVILSCIKAFEIINSCLDEDYSNALNWLNDRLAEVWEDRGAFPGLGAMLCALEIPLGILIAKETKDNLNETEDTWTHIPDAKNRYMNC